MKRIITGLILGLFTFFFVFLTNDLIFKVGLISLLVFAIYELFKIKTKKNIFIWIIFFMILVNIALIFPITQNFARNFFFTALLISVFTDIFALVFGKLIGKNFVFPNISPKKTLEGTISGIIFPAIIVIVLGYLFLELN